MAYGFKSGGRKAGTPNKQTTELREKIEERLGKPVTIALIDLYERVSCPQLKAKILFELMPYIYPKLKGAELLAEVPEKENDRLVVTFSGTQSEISKETVSKSLLKLTD